MDKYDVQYAQVTAISNLMKNSTKVDTESIDKTVSDLQHKIDEVQADIRKERRIFLDSNVSESPAIAGLYFTKVPDNQILIAFISCFGAFLFFVGLLIILNKIPIDAFSAMTMANRLTTVGLFWCLTLILSYILFYSFT
jgi:hypothetical protein